MLEAWGKVSRCFATFYLECISGLRDRCLDKRLVFIMVILIWPEAGGVIPWGESTGKSCLCGGWWL